MSLDKILKYLDLTQADFLEHSRSFVPYIYIDGHRSSGISDDDAESYKSGVDFFSSIFRYNERAWVQRNGYDGSH